MLLAAVVGFRLARPALLAPLVGRHLSQALGARVHVGDLGLRPIDGVVTLRDVRVEPSEEALASGRSVMPIVADQVRADVQWLPLVHKTLRLRELLLDGAQVELERASDGGLGLAGLGEPDASKGLPSDWSFELDRVGLRDSKVRLRDPAAIGAKPFELRVREGEISGLRRRATAFGRTANMRLDADVGSGRLASYGRYDFGDDGLSVDLRTRMKNVPVAEAVANLPDLGWGEVSGLLSGVVRWQRDPDRRDKVSGRVMLRRGEIRVPAFEVPAFAVRRITADIDAVDLVERHVGIGNLVLQGASLAVRPDASDPVPLFGPGDAPAPTPAPAPAGRRKRAAADDEEDKAPPWVWIVKKFDTPNGRIRSITSTGIVEARARASGENVGPRAYWSPVKLRVWSGEGAAEFDGTARIGRHFAAEGRVTAGGVDVGQLARAAGVHGAEWIQGGRLAADLNLQLDTGEREGQPLDATGPVLLTEIFLSGPLSGEFSAGASEASLTVTGVSLRGRGARPSPVSALRCTDVRVQQPWLVLERTASGFTVPTAAEDLVAASTAATPTPKPVPAATPKPDRRKRSKPSDSADAAKGGDALPSAPVLEEFSPQLVLAGVRMANGRILVVDRVPEPPVVWDVSRVDAVGRDVRLPSPAVDGLRLSGHDSRFGDVQLAMRRGERRDGWDFAAQGMLLSAASPYLQLAGLPFRFGGGTGAVDTSVSIGESDWTADTEVTLRDPRFLGSVGALEDAMGRTIGRALGELRDDEGNVTVRLPLSSVEASRPASLVQAIAKSVREEVRRIALEPPRPPVQAPRDEEEQEDLRLRPSAQPTPRPAPTPVRRRTEVSRVDVSFPPGRAELNQLAVEQVSAVAKTLLSRPEVRVQLSAAVTPEDRRWLAEQALGAELARPDALRGVLRAFGVGAARERIRAALAARAQGLPGLLSAEDEEELREYLSERPPVGAAEVAALREARLTRVANRLSDYHGVSRRRVEVERVELPGVPTPVVRLAVVDETSRAAASGGTPASAPSAAEAVPERDSR